MPRRYVIPKREFRWITPDTREFVMDSEDWEVSNRKPVCPKCGLMTDYRECTIGKHREAYYYICIACDLRTAAILQEGE